MIVNNILLDYIMLFFVNGSVYSIIVIDVNDCNFMVVFGIFFCDCVMVVGFMAINLVIVCEDEAVILIFNQDVQLDFNDILLFVLYDNNGILLGFIFVENDSLVFNFQVGMNFGQIYYVFVVVIDVILGGVFDYSSFCFLVFIGVFVVFYVLLVGILIGDIVICEGVIVLFIFDFVGIVFFDFIYEVNGVFNMVENVNLFYLLLVMLDGVVIYVLISFSDSFLAGCSNILLDSVIVIFNFLMSVNQILEICQGDSLLLGGVF